MILQWGHRLSAMETRTERFSIVSSKVPSMGPPPFGDGNSSGGGRRRRWPCPSMGPPPFGDGNDELLELITALSNPSMGPPPFGDGNLPWTVDVEFVDALQWGHRLSAMETVVNRRVHFQCHVPSMGPPPFGDGNMYGSDVYIPVISTFNGATAFRRWKPEFGVVKHG